MHKKSTKFLVTVSYKRIDFELGNNFEPEDINIKWWRQFRTTDTLKIGESPVWNKTWVGDNGYSGGKSIFRFPCEPSLKVTLHKSKKDKPFEKKNYKFAIESVRYDGRAKVLASAEFDVSEYASATRDTPRLVSLPLEPKKKCVLKAVVNFSISFEFIRSGDSKDADMVSVWSRDSLELDRSGEDFDSTFVGDGIWDLSVASFVEKLEDHKSDLLVPEVGRFLSDLSLSKLIVLVTNSDTSDVSNEIISATNKFHSNAKAKFGNEIELIYLSIDKKETAPAPDLRCPRVRTSSELQSVITQDFDIATAPYLIVLSQDRLVACSSDPSHILTHLSSKSSETVVEKWLKTTPPPSMPPGEEGKLPSSERSCRSLPERQLQDKISDLRKISLRRSSMPASDCATKPLRTISVQQAEKNVRATLMKRGVSGLTGRVWRPRQFQYRDGKIEYLEKKKKEVRGCIDLKEVLSFEVLPSDRQDKNNGTFNVVTKDRVFEMQALDAEQMSNWIAAAETLKKRQIKKLENITEIRK